MGRGVSRAAGLAWWSAKARQFMGHLTARVSSGERAALEGWLAPAQLALFDAMHVADRRHGLDVVASLRRDGVDDPAALLAGLLHDAGKGRTGLWPRVAWSLGEAWGDRALALAGRVPALGAGLAVLRDHPSRSADLAAAAGCPPRTLELIRNQDAPVDPEYGPLLRLADEAN